MSSTERDEAMPTDATHATTSAHRKRPWRTGDVPLSVAALGYVLASVAVIALAASGSWIGMIGAGTIICTELAVIIQWSGAPFDS